MLGPSAPDGQIPLAIDHNDGASRPIAQVQHHIITARDALAENRELAAEVAPSWAKAPPPCDDIVRRYDLEPPLVRDALTGWTSGKPDALSAVGFTELLYRRAEAAASGARNEAAG